MKTIPARLAPLVLLVLSGCLPVFTDPIPPEDPPFIDPQVEGAWVGEENRDDGGSMTASFDAAGRVTWVVLGAPEEEGGEPDRTVYRGYATRAGSVRIFCLRPVPEDGEEPRGYFLCAYRLTDDGVLRLLLFAQDKVRAMVEQGTLAGEIKKQRYADRVTVTAPASAVVDLLDKEGLAAFCDPEDAVRLVRP